MRSSSARRGYGHQNNPIDVEEDDITAKVAVLSIEQEQDNIPNLIDFPNDDDDDDSIRDDFVGELTPNELIDLPIWFYQSRSATPAITGFNTLTTPLGVVVRPGMSVELSDGDFLHIHHLSRTNETCVRGILLQRTRKINDMLPKKYNELCAILKTKTQTEGSDPSIDNCLVSRPLTDVLVAREIIFTNRPFPELSFREGEKLYMSWAKVEEEAVLICRSKYIEFCDAAQKKVTAQAVLWLGEKECTPEQATSNAWLKQKWRGDWPKKPQPKHQVRLADIMQVTKKEFESRPSKKRATVDLTSENDEFEELETTVTHNYKRVKRGGTYERRSNSITTERIKLHLSEGSIARSPALPRPARTLQLYTIGDICTGAGGMVIGAILGGLQPVFLLDHWDDACKTLELNFKGTKIHNAEIFEFCTNKIRTEDYHRVDVLHISFPCQPHSSAHRTEGKNDEKNIATGYSAIPILEKCRPRVVTFEQTSGIMTHHGRHLRALVHQLTAMRYNVRWKIVNCAEYGVVQARKRVIIIASCPGEALPQFPKPTHGDGPGLKPFVTIRDVLTKLRGFSSPPHMQRYTVKAGVPYNADQPLRNCITTDGGKGNTHPSGNRSFTLQELACLAGFPPSHQFFGTETSIKKQIGNAVAPPLGKALYKEIVKSLRKSDDLEAETGVKWQSEVVVID